MIKEETNSPNNCQVIELNNKIKANSAVLANSINSLQIKRERVMAKQVSNTRGLNYYF